MMVVEVPGELCRFKLLSRTAGFTVFQQLLFVMTATPIHSFLLLCDSLWHLHADNKMLQATL